MASPRAREWALVAVLLLVGFAVRAREIARYSLWLDEAWVGVTSRTQTIGDFLTSLSSTPVLFALSIKLSQATVRQPELAPRLVPLVFATLALVLAFRLGRELAGPSAGLLALGLLAFQPAAIAYAKQVKQYSADVAFALAIAWLGLRFLAKPSARNAWALTLVAALAPGFSHTALFVNAALLLTVVVSARQFDRGARWRAACVGAVVSLASLTFFAFAQRYVNSSLTAYWQDFYLPRQPGQAGLVALQRIEGLLSSRADLSVLLLLAAVGGMAYLLRSRPAAPGLVGLVVAEAIGAALADRYPLGDERTSLYLTSLLLVASAVGLGLLVTRARRLSQPLAVAGVVVAVGWAGWTIPWATIGRFQQVEDAGPLIRYLDQNEQADDVILVYYASTFVVAYYSAEPWTIESLPRTPNGYAPRFANPNIYVLPAHRDNNPAYDAEIKRIAAVAGGRRIWFILSHRYDDEATYLTQRLAQIGPIVHQEQRPNAILLLVQPNKE